MNILIADDSSYVRKNLKTIFTELGHTVVAEVANGQDAVMYYDMYKPDVLTIDITMPILDGIDALTQIISNYPAANVIMISALGQRNKIFEAIEKGAKNYVIKPVTKEKIEVVMDKLMSG